jgi:hypothetical protein
MIRFKSKKRRRPGISITLGSFRNSFKKFLTSLVSGDWGEPSWIRRIPWGDLFEPDDGFKIPDPHFFQLFPPFEIYLGPF